MTRDSGDLTLLIHRSMVSAGWDVDTLYARLGYDVRDIACSRGFGTPSKK